MTPSSIPDTWAWSTLGEIADVVGGVTKDGKKQADPTLPLVPYLRVANVQRGYLDLKEIAHIRVPDSTREKLRLQRDDVLLNEGGDRDKLGRGWVWQGQIPDCIHQNHVFRARLFKDTLHPKLLALYANECARGWFDRNATQSVNLASISLSKIRQLPIPIPPWSEQERILSTLEDHLSRLDVGRATLGATSATRTAAIRASILDAAVRGRLSETFQSDSSVEDLIFRSLEQANNGIGPARRARTLSPSAEQALAPYEIPPSWRWAPWSQLGASLNGVAFPSTEYSNNGIKLLRPGNLHESGRVVWTDHNTRFLPKSYEERNPRYVVNGRALIMNLTAQSLKDNFLGRVCLTSATDQVLLNQRLAWLQPFELDLDYTFIVLRSPLFRRFVNQLNTGSLIQHMHTWQLAHFQFPVPPFEEQTRIVSKVNESVAIVDRLERSLSTAIEASRRLRSQLFLDAFTGRLVEQDPADEAAQQLLARVRQESVVPRPTRPTAGRAAKKARPPTPPTDSKTPARAGTDIQEGTLW